MLKLKSPDHKDKDELWQGLKRRLSSECHGGKQLGECEKDAKIWASAISTIETSKTTLDQMNMRAVSLAEKLNQLGMMAVHGKDLIEWANITCREQSQLRPRLLEHWYTVLYGTTDLEDIRLDMGGGIKKIDIPEEVTRNVLEMKAEFDMLSYKCLQESMKYDLAVATDNGFERQIKVHPLPRRCTNLCVCV